MGGVISVLRIFSKRTTVQLPLPPRISLLFKMGDYGGDNRGPALEMWIPGGKVGLVIGRGGATVQRLQSDSGARTKITDDSDESGNKMVMIWGSEDEKAAAKGMIDDVCSVDGISKHCFAVVCFLI